MTEQTNARDLFRAAYENRYTWDANFPGYSADVELKQGSEAYKGNVRINRDFSVDVTGIENEQVKEDIYTQMRDVITHRKRTPFEQAHAKNDFNLGNEDSTGALEIFVKGDAMGSNYKIRGKEICQVSRVMGRIGFVIDTKETLDTGSGYVPTRYDVVFRNPQTGEVTAQRQHEDKFEKIGDYYIMTREVLHSNEEGEQTTVEFNFSNIKLLEPVSV